MSHSPPPHHDGVSNASPSHAPETSNLPSSINREVPALPPPPPPPRPPPPQVRHLWTEREHRLFLQGLNQFGKGKWKEISENFLQSKTYAQVASHAQKYFIHQSSQVRKRKSIFDETQETVQPSCPSNLVTMQQQRRRLSTPHRLKLNLNHPVIMPMQQDSTPRDRDQNCSVKRRWQQDSTHDNDNDNVNHSVPRPLLQVPARHDGDISHPSKHRNHIVRNIHPPPQHLYIDMIIGKSEEGHLDIFVKDSNQVKVQSVITLQGSPLHVYHESHQIHIPYFCSESLPPQQYRVILKNFATQP